MQAEIEWAADNVQSSSTFLEEVCETASPIPVPKVGSTAQDGAAIFGKQLR